MKTRYDYLKNDKPLESDKMFKPFDIGNALNILHTVEDGKEIAAWKDENRLIFEKLVDKDENKRMYAVEIKFDEDGFPYRLHELTSDLVDGKCVKATEVHAEGDKHHIEAKFPSLVKREPGEWYYKHYIFEHEPAEFTLEDVK